MIWQSFDTFGHDNSTTSSEQSDKLSVLTQVELPSTVDEIPVPAVVRKWIAEATQRIQAFQDRWDKPQIEQFVAADYELVYQSLCWTLRNQPLLGRRFLEWGCGFAVVSALASSLDLDAIGIEAETELLRQGRQTMSGWDLDLELIHGNFLPRGSEDLADDPMLPSLGHDVPDAYETLGLELDDFSIVYAYPWPGEDEFHRLVFDQHADVGALLMQFCGPYDIRLWRKVS